MSAKVAYYNNGFGLFAARRRSRATRTTTCRGETVGTYYDYYPVRPQKAINVDGSYFKQGLGGNHELKFGFGYRDVTSNTTTHWNGNQLVGYINTRRRTSIAKVYRDGVVGYDGQVPRPLRRRRLHARTGSRSTPACAGTSRRPRTSRARLPRTRRFPDVLPAPLVRRRQRLPDRLEGLLAARRPQLRPRPVAEDRAARVVRALRRPAVVRLGARTRTRSPPGTSRTTGTTRTATASCSRARCS